MIIKPNIHQVQIYKKIRALSNRCRFKIIEITNSEPASITSLSKKLNLSYTKCCDYVAILEKEGLISKNKEGKKVIVKSKVKLNNSSLNFL